MGTRACVRGEKACTYAGVQVRVCVCERTCVCVQVGVRTYPGVCVSVWLCAFLRECVRHVLHACVHD